MTDKKELEDAIAGLEAYGYATTRRVDGHYIITGPSRVTTARGVILQWHYLTESQGEEDEMDRLADQAGQADGR